MKRQIINMKQGLMFGAVAAALCSATYANSQTMEVVSIIGSKHDARQLLGTGSVIDSEQMEIEAARDINQLLKTIPGIYIQEEDGFGLRPNIGIRGAISGRSSKITLMEDGVLIAPAPYSNPAAYYFPTTSRMHAVEVLKGAPLLRYGPQTTGGVINLISTPIPDEMSGNINLSYGENAEADLLANYGGRSGDFGFLIETTQRRNDGFKTIDGSNSDTGYDISDYLVKLLWEGESQSVSFKAQYSEEVSEETYLGLTDADFNRDEDRRYGLSELDQMDNDHSGYNLVYRNELSDSVSMSATAYYNEFSRDWFKLSGGGSFVEAANAGDAFAQGVLDGTEDVTDLQYKHNNREYTSRGVELNFDVALGNHQLALGGRIHEDEMDRFQPVEYFSQIDGQLVFDRNKAPTGSNNRLETADANSLWAVDNWAVNDALNVNLAMRWEDVDSSRKQFADEGRTQLDSRRSNSNSQWLPGASFTYDLSDTWQVLAGVHKGFSPLGGGAVDNQEPETSTNWEAGVRYNGTWFVEVVGFYSDFEDKTEDCSNADPCSNGSTSGSFVTGEAVVAGIEFQASSSFELGNFILPVDLMYTYTDAKISEDNAETGFMDGDQLPSIAQNTFSLRLGLEGNNGWGNYLVAKYTDEMCMEVGCNNSSADFDKSDEIFVVDFISRYRLSDDSVVFLKVENTLDERAIVSRQPDGARPNKPRTAIVGIEWSF
jgi:Fe(3+) dicitrate transport protein